MSVKKENTARQFTLDDIYSFLIEEIGPRKKELIPDIRIYDDLGVDGDDFFELVEHFAKRFNVDMTGYRWYFHHRDEAAFGNIGAFFFAPPYKRVKPIPVTPALLLESANKGAWPIKYPEHTLPDRRYDILIYYIFVSLPLLIIIIAHGLAKLFGIFKPC